MTPSHQRLLTTHVGSLPRSPNVIALLFAQDRGEPYDECRFETAMSEAVEEVVSRQLQAGLDIVSDGEASKISYATYIRHRLSGFEGDSPRPTPRDLDEFPAFRDRLLASGGSATYRRPICTGAITQRDSAPVRRDIERLKTSLAGGREREGFLSAVSPGTIAVFHPNEYYATHELYIEALAAAMRAEYECIVASGLMLQVDCPDLAMGRHSRFKHLSDAEFLRHAQLHIDALNYALENVPADRVRLHVCWGNYEGPHIHDIPLTALLPLLFSAKPHALLIEGGNPRHEHEWEVWKSHRLPAGKMLIPGVIDTSTNFVEHPELVAQRLLRYASVVGPDRVIAGTDCGLGSFAGFGPVHPDIAWLKLDALVEGAAIASKRLWGRQTLAMV